MGYDYRKLTAGIEIALDILVYSLKIICISNIMQYFRVKTINECFTCNEFSTCHAMILEFAVRVSGQE